MATDGLTDLEQEAWRGFLVTHDRLWRALAAGLGPLNVSMAEYSVLSLLHEAGPNGMRMSDLAQRHLMSSGGFTRLADRLESRGLIERRRSAIDGRGFDATLTRSGQALIRRARRQHHSDLHELFFSRLDDDHLRSLAEIWALLDPTADAERGDGSPSASTKPGAGPPTSPKVSTDSEPPSPDPAHLRKTPARPRNSGVEPRPPGATPGHQHAHRQHSPSTSPADTRESPP